MLKQFGRAYKIVNLDEPGNRHFVHRLVLTAFRGPCPTGKEGCHNDGDHTNNQLRNLRWDTHRNNQREAFFVHKTLKSNYPNARRSRERK